MDLKICGIVRIAMPILVAAAISGMSCLGHFGARQGFKIESRPAPQVQAQFSALTNSRSRLGIPARICRDLADGYVIAALAKTTAASRSGNCDGIDIDSFADRSALQPAISPRLSIIAFSMLPPSAAFWNKD